MNFSNVPKNDCTSIALQCSADKSITFCRNSKQLTAFQVKMNLTLLRHCAECAVSVVLQRNKTQNYMYYKRPIYSHMQCAFLLWKDFLRKGELRVKPKMNLLWAKKNQLKIINPFSKTISTLKQNTKKKKKKKKNKMVLTLTEVTKVLLLPLVPKGGSMEPLKKTTFPPEFCNEICTIYVWTIKNYNSARKNLKMLYRFKMATK